MSGHDIKLYQAEIAELKAENVALRASNEKLVGTLKTLQAGIYGQSDMQPVMDVISDALVKARQYQGMDLSTGEDKTAVTPAPNLTWTDDQIQIWKDKIGKMTHIEMAHLHRFAPAGHPVFSKTLPLFEYFEKRFQEFGGMTPEISKAIGL